MGRRENADGNWSENSKIEEEKEDLRTVNCLRGRLLAERLASRNATLEAEHLRNKLQELENQLNEESKSRKRAEKKLKFLIKRLENVESFENILHENDSQLSKGSSRWSNDGQPISHKQTINPNSNQILCIHSTTNELSEEEVSRDGKIEMNRIDVSVKQVLESLRHAKEQLQSSMEKRRLMKMMSMNIIKVG